MAAAAAETWDMVGDHIRISVHLQGVPGMAWLPAVFSLGILS